RELRCVPDGDNLAVGQDLAGILLGTEHDATAKPPGTRGTWSGNSHPSSMPRQIRSSPVYSWRGGGLAMSTRIGSDRISKYGSDPQIAPVVTAELAIPEL